LKVPKLNCQNHPREDDGRLDPPTRERRLDGAC
jgi:hypothetical protein